MHCGKRSSNRDVDLVLLEVCSHFKESLYHQFPDSVKFNFKIILIFFYFLFTVNFLINHSVSCMRRVTKDAM